MKRILYIVLFFAVNTSTILAADFQIESKGLGVLKDLHAKHGLAAFVDFGNGKIYAVTTLSLFLSGIDRFTIKDFKGNRIKTVSTQVAWDKDLVRMEVVPTPFIKPFKPSTSKPDRVYFIQPVYGTISITPYKQENLPHIPSSVIIGKDGGIAGFVSFITDYSKYDSKETQFVTINSKKWSPCNLTHLRTQLTLLQKLNERTFTLERLRSLAKMNNFMSFQPSYASTYNKWLEKHNEQFYNYRLARFQGGKSMGAAKLKHESRCTYYSALRTLYSYSKNLLQTIDITQWKSSFLRECAIKLRKRTINLKKGLDNQMKQMVKQFPATKTKL